MSVNVKIENIYSIVMRTGRIKVFDIFSMAKSRSELVASFLAILEMAKDKSIKLTGELEILGALVGVFQNGVGIAELTVTCV